MEILKASPRVANLTYTNNLNNKQPERLNSKQLNNDLDTILQTIQQEFSITSSDSKSLSGVLDQIARANPTPPSEINSVDVMEVSALLTTSYQRTISAAEDSTSEDLSLYSSFSTERSGQPFINNYSSAQQSYLISILLLSLEQSDLNLETASILAENNKRYEEMANLLNALQSFTIALNTQYKEMLNTINKDEALASKPASNTFSLEKHGDFSKYYEAAIEISYEENNGLNGYLGVYKPSGFESGDITYRWITTINVHGDGKVTIEWEQWSGSGGHDGKDTDDYDNIKDAYKGYCNWMGITDLFKLPSGVELNRGNVLELFKVMLKTSLMQEDEVGNKDNLYFSEIPKELAPYFESKDKIVRNGYTIGFKVRPSEIKTMMAAISNKLASVIPGYAPEKFNTDWGNQILNNTGCEQLIGTVSSLIDTVAKITTAAADKVGMLQDKISLARELLGSILDAIKQMNNY